MGGRFLLGLLIFLLSFDLACRQGRGARPPSPPPPAVLSALPQLPRLELAWRGPAVDGAMTRPITGFGLAFAAGQDQVQAFAVATGNPVWQQPIRSSRRL